MNDATTISLVWWITAVELPVLAGLFWMIYNSRREHDRAILRLHTEIQGQLAVLLDNITQFKLEVARVYVTMPQLKDLEKRLTQHLLRLEDRIIHINGHTLVQECRRRNGESAGHRRESGHDV